MLKQVPFYFLCLLCCFLSACAVKPSGPAPTQPASSQDQLFYQHIISIGQAIDQGQLEQSQAQLSLLSNQQASADQRCLLAYAYAKLAIAKGNISLANSLLNNQDIQDDLQQASNPVLILTSLLNANLLAQQKNYLKAAHIRVYLAALMSDAQQSADNQKQIWQLLSQVDVNTLDSQAFAGEQDMRQWLALSKIVQHSRTTLDQQISQLKQWLADNPQHPAALNPPAEVSLIFAAAAKRANHIAIILPLEGKYQASANAIRDGFMHAWYHANHQAQLTFYSSEEAQDFASVYQEAIDNGADMVIGPLLKEQLKALYQLPSPLPVPTIALNELDNNALPAPANLYQFSLSLDDEVSSLISLAQNNNDHNVLVFYQNDDWAKKAADQFSTQWQALSENNHIIAQSPFINTKDQALQTKQLLNIDKSQARHYDLQRLTGLNLSFEPRRRKDVDMIVLITRPKAATSIKPLLAFYYAGNIPVYATSSVYQGYADRLANSDLDGICFSDSPLVINRDDSLLAKNYQQSPYIRLYAMGIDAFRLSERLALMLSDPTPLYGATGLLHLSGAQLIRQTDYACFDNGYAKELKLSTPTQDHHDETDNSQPPLDGSSL